VATVRDPRGRRTLIDGERRHTPRLSAEEERRQRATEIRESMHDERAVTVAKPPDGGGKRKHRQAG
jgi:hypothetical protein